MKKSLLFVLCLLAALPFLAQKVYSLEECIEVAIKNSLLTQQAQLNLQDAGTDITQARHNKYPDLNLSIGHGLNFGRSIDPSTNDFINQQITRGGFYAGSNVPVWQAGRFNQAVRQYQYAEEAARWALKNQEDNLRLQVTLAYLLVLNSQDQASRLRIQEELTAQQLRRLEDLDKNGAALPGALSDMRGQLASEQISRLDAEQQISTSKLSLAQLMNIPFDNNMQIAPDSRTGTLNQGESSWARLAESMNYHALIRSGEFTQQSVLSYIQSLKASRYPQFGIGMEMGSNYSSAYQIQGSKVKFTKQISNNFNYAVGLSLSLPILNNYRLRSNLQKAQTLLQRSKNDIAQARNLVQQRIGEALLLQANAGERFRILQNQVDAFRESFRIAEVRFNQGVLNSVEYLVVKNNLDRSEIQAITARYELSFREKVVEFYANLKQ